MRMIRNPVPWPDGATCAVAFTWDVDAESVLQIDHPETAHRRIFSLSAMRYGPEISVPRICDIFAEFGHKSTFFVPTWVAEQYPAAMERMVGDGHEIGHHGYLHESPNLQSAEDEAYWFQRAHEGLEAITGQKIIGYRAPSFDVSPTTQSLLNGAGYLYDSSLMADDVPYIMRENGKDLIEIPATIIHDDWPHFSHNWDLGATNQISTPSRAKELYLSEFDAVCDDGGLWVGVWHPWISGRPARARMMIEMIEYMQKRATCWFAPLKEIAGHIAMVTADGTWNPNVHQMPFHPGKLKEWDMSTWQPAGGKVAATGD